MSKPKSEVRECDRCGQYYEVSNLHHRYIVRRAFDVIDEESEMDLCDYCYGIVEKVLSSDITRDVENRIRDCN